MLWKLTEQFWRTRAFIVIYSKSSPPDMFSICSSIVNAKIVYKSKKHHPTSILELYSWKAILGIVILPRMESSSL